MNLKKEFNFNQAILLVLPSDKYLEFLPKSLKSISAKNICYVSFNKTCSSVSDFLNRNDIKYDSISFVDAISKTVTLSPVKIQGCSFVSSPGALTELSLKIDELLKGNFDFLVIDSLNNLLIYEKKPFVEKFILRVVNRVKETKTNALFFTMGSVEQKEFISEISVFFDKVIDLGV